MQTLSSARGSYWVCLYFQIHTGKCNDKANHGPTHRVVMDLIALYLYKNHNLHFDNYYNSPKILKDGVSKNNYACGTIHVNRVVFPDDFKDTKLAPEEALFIQEGNVMATHLKDKRDVFIISLIHDNKFNDVLRRRGDTILKPKMIMKYNKFMDGVGKCD